MQRPAPSSLCAQVKGSCMRRQMGVPLNSNPHLNVAPVAAAAAVQQNPPRGFDVVWSLDHAEDVGEPATWLRNCTVSRTAAKGC